MKDWKKILNDDFFEIFDRDVYVSRKNQIVISYEYIEDHSDDEIINEIKKNSHSSVWTFISNESTSDENRIKILELLK